ncbi:hypothetical protein GCM10025859_04750 [Alicyclobacillus fastidiosus]|nr:hypothetical protein GCM10025859_04750 [Alicyclobacillus fastidiosus]
MYKGGVCLSVVTTWGRKVYIDLDQYAHCKGRRYRISNTKLIELMLGQIMATKTAEEVPIFILDLKEGASFSYCARCPQA